MRWLSALRARVILLFAPKGAESRMNDEMDFHIEMETDRLMREQGLPWEAARRQALVTFGGMTQHKETMRDARGLAWLAGMSLDFKLGFRMLRKYPGLTVVGGLAMAFGIWVGAVVFQMVHVLMQPTLPLPDGDRIVQIRNYDVKESRLEKRMVHDFMLWRQTLKSVTDLGAYREVPRNLISGDKEARAMQVVEITASAFRIAPARPHLGRVLSADDERAGSPPVIVIGHEVWKNRFASDPNIIGRTAQLGDEFPTIVGVMPEGFRFPKSHDIWSPLRVEQLEQAPRAGSSITVFGKLAPGASLKTAQAELTTLGKRLATELPATHAHLQPQVGPYAEMFNSPNSTDTMLMGSFNFFAIMFIALICSTVALLLFARAATRESEIVVRSALGASRSRIVMQLFAEALVLGAVAAVVGLLAANFALVRWGTVFLEENMGPLPFWYDLRISPVTVLYVAGLTLIAAAIAGVLPGLKVTRGLGSRLKQGTAGAGGLQFGGVWTAVIITQVAFTVAFPIVIYVEQRELRRIRTFDANFAAKEYLGLFIESEAPAGSTWQSADSASRAAQSARFGAARERFRERLSTEPGVLGVTFVDRLPRDYHRDNFIELQDTSAAAALAERIEAKVLPPLGGDAAFDHLNEVSMAFIDPSYFAVLRTPILAGRAFTSGDLGPDAHVAIVDEGFVHRVLQGRNAIGQRFRWVPARMPDGTLSEAPRPWYEIVGVVKDLGMAHAANGRRPAGAYFPVDVKTAGPLHMIVHVQGDPMTMASRVREVAAAVDPTLQVSNLQALDKVADPLLWVLRLWIKISSMLVGVALLLSLAGIYAVLSFTVARRTREIGVRVALGASRRKLVVAIFRRPLIQVSLGVLAGTLLIGLLGYGLTGGLTFTQFGMLALYASLMFGVCLLACIVPTRRALGVEPMEALRVE